MYGTTGGISMPNVWDKNLWKRINADYDVKQFVESYSSQEKSFYDIQHSNEQYKVEGAYADKKPLNKGIDRYFPVRKEG